MRKSLRRLLARILPAFFRGLAFTWRLRVSGSVPHGPGVLALWHSDMLPVLSLLAYRGHLGLASLSRDGDLISRLLHSLQQLAVSQRDPIGNQRRCREIGCFKDGINDVHDNSPSIA